MTRTGRHRFVYALSACALALASPTLAQEIGNYAGQTADGHAITFSVSTDPNDGKLELKSLTVGFSAACPESGTTINQAESFGLSDGPYDIVSHKVSQLWSSNELYMLNNVTFTSKTQAKGNTRTALPQIVPGSIPPKKAELCVSSTQAFQATFQGTGVSDAELPELNMMERSRDGIREQAADHR